MSSYREGRKGCQDAVFFFLALNKVQQSMQGDPSAAHLTVLIDLHNVQSVVA